MKKTYESVNMEVIQLCAEDILTISLPPEILD
jgi:hypothetical protein